MLRRVGNLLRIRTHTVHVYSRIKYHQVMLPLTCSQWFTDDYGYAISQAKIFQNDSKYFKMIPRYTTWFELIISFFIIIWIYLASATFVRPGGLRPKITHKTCLATPLVGVVSATCFCWTALELADHWRFFECSCCNRYCTVMEEKKVLERKRNDRKNMEEHWRTLEDTEIYWRYLKGSEGH